MPSLQTSKCPGKPFPGPELNYMWLINNVSKTYYVTVHPFMGCIIIIDLFQLTASSMKYIDIIILNVNIKTYKNDNVNFIKMYSLFVKYFTLTKIILNFFKKSID